MKIWSVFSLVIVFHLLIIGLLLVQPGCQSQSAPEPSPEMTRPSPATGTTPSVASPQPLDPAFNAGVAPAPSTTGRSGLQAPSRPSGGTAALPAGRDTGGVLQPVREPVTDSFSLPPVNREVKVAKGDTLSGIARREGVSLQALMAANGLDRNATIFVGQSLLVPEAASGEDVSARETGHGGETTVTVRRGDTLSGIAARNGTTVQVLKSLNSLRGETIFVGQELRVPSSEPVRGTSASRGIAQGGMAYTVKSGDTVSGIAARFGVSSRQLMDANGITDPRRLFAGQTLTIPGTTREITEPEPASEPALAQPAPRPMSEPTRSAPVEPEPVEEDPMSALEALEDDDLPFVEVERVETPGN